MTTTESPAEVRPGETTLDAPAAFDAGVWFVGRIRTPWATRDDCPRRGDAEAGPLCRVEIAPPWDACLAGVEAPARLQLLYWMHRGRRDLATQTPRRAGPAKGTFALRSPMRPNPVASSVVALVGREGSTLIVRGLDCVDGTPLIDVKPDDCPHG